MTAVAESRVDEPLQSFTVSFPGTASDEASKAAEFADAEDFVTGLAMRALHPNIIVLRTFSKAYGLAGLRVGFGIGQKQIF